MRRLLAVLLIVNICFSSLINPPVAEVDANNTAIAPSESQLPLHENVLQVEEREPSLDNPAYFAYAKILTLTPAVNWSVTSTMHPKAVWIVAEKHKDTITVRYPNGDCPDTVITRNFKDAEIGSITLNFTAEGLAEKTAEGMVFHNVSEEKAVFFTWFDIDENVSLTHYENPAKAPFEENTSVVCMFACAFSDLIFSDPTCFDCYYDALKFASPRPEGVYNATVRNITIVKPQLKVGLKGQILINYTEHRDSWSENEKGNCEKDDNEDREGVVSIPLSDYQEYLILNPKMSLLPISPGLTNMTANTPDIVDYSLVLFSNAPIYKVYQKMDNKTATPVYGYNFDVTNDSYGTQFIVANQINVVGFAEGDPEAANNYTGESVLRYYLNGTYLLNPQNFVNQTYNYSFVYAFRETFFNMTKGPHQGESIFFDWFGANHSMKSDIVVYKPTTLQLSLREVGETSTVIVFLTSEGEPVSGQPVTITAGSQSRTVRTDGSGMVSAEFQNNFSSVTATYAGAGDPTYLLGSMATRMKMQSLQFGDMGQLDFSAGMSVLLFFGAMGALALLQFSNLAGGFLGRSPLSMFGIGALGDKKGPSKAELKRKQKKQLVKQIILAVVTGGAGAAAAGGGAAAGGAATAKAGGAAAAKGGAAAAKGGGSGLTKEMKARIELGGKGKKGKDFDLGGKDLKKAVPKKMTTGAAGEPDKNRDPYAILKNSMKRVDKEVCKSVAKKFQDVRIEKIDELKQHLKNNDIKDRATLRNSVNTLSKTKLHVVEQRVWESEIPNLASEAGKIIRNPARAYGFYDPKMNEIFISENRAKEPIGMEKTLRHEIDHVVCKFSEPILKEGHADKCALRDMMSLGFDIDEKYVSYTYSTKTYGIISELANGEDSVGHAAYGAGSKELKNIIEERYKEPKKMEELINAHGEAEAKRIISELPDKLDSIMKERLLFAGDALDHAEALLRELEPRKHKEIMRRLG